MTARHQTTQITAQQLQTTSKDFILNLENWSEFEITREVVERIEPDGEHHSFWIHPASPAGEEPVGSIWTGGG